MGIATLYCGNVYFSFLEGGNDASGNTNYTRVVGIKGKFSQT